MVMATLPRVLGPTETVTLPVTVFADDGSVKNVKVEVQTNNLLVPADEMSKNVSFRKPGNEVVNFTMKVAKAIGVARVKITATSGKYKADYEIELNVRNPNPPAYEYSGTIIQGGQQYNQVLEMIGMPGTNKASIEVSTLPPVDLNRRLSWLIHYPYGCIEQTTSSVFPQLFLNDILDLSKEKLDEIEVNVKAGVNRVKEFQTKEGGLSYWPGEGENNEWASNYGGHFMIEAEAKGYKLPAGFKQSWVKYQKSRASNWTGESNYYYYYDYGLTQAYRLYTLALAGEPEMGAMNRLREKSNNSLQTRWMLAASYVLAGQPEVAKQITTNLSIDIKPYWETGYTYGTDLRDKAMILETYSLMKDFAHGSLIAEDIAKKLSSDEWYGTHTLAYCLIAFSKYAKASNLSKGNFEFAFKIDNEPVSNVSSKNAIFQVKPEVTNKSKISVNIVNKNKGALYVRFYREGVPIAGSDKDAESDLTLRIVYKDMKGNMLNVENMKQGTDFKAEVTIKNNNGTTYVQNLALTQIVPSGWEIINTRLADLTAAGTINIPDYQDIRDDRVMSFFDLKAGETKTFTLLFNSTYQGEFYLPSVNCEAMYDHRIYARKAGNWVKVEK
jgi:uncharacterized protein YfaS (alpha-2-macroglobulin family)